MKFLKEYSLVLERFGIEEGSDLNMLQFGNILTDLRMITDNGTNDDLLFEAWKSVSPQDESTVSETSIGEFVLGVYKNTEKMNTLDPKNGQTIGQLAMNRVTLSAVDRTAHRIKDDSSIIGSEPHSDINPTFKPQISMNS